jgi:hypothetical protein
MRDGEPQQVGVVGDAAQHDGSDARAPERSEGGIESAARILRRVEQKFRILRHRIAGEARDAKPRRAGERER